MNLEPIPNRVARNPANGVALVVTENDAKLAIVSRLRELVREFDQLSLDVVGFAPRHVVVNAVFHAFRNLLAPTGRQSAYPFVSPA